MGHKCKHIFAAEIVYQRELFPDGTEVETKTVTLTESDVKRATIAANSPPTIPKRSRIIQAVSICPHACEKAGAG
jgi:hypothetical protein